MCETEVDDLENHKKFVALRELDMHIAQEEEEANYQFWHSTLKSEKEDDLNLKSEILKPCTLISQADNGPVHCAE